MFCSSCGQQLVEGVRFCQSCGRSTSGIELKQSSARTISQLTLAQQEWIESRKKSKGIAVLLALLLTGAANIYAGDVVAGVIVVLIDLFIFVPLMFLGIGFVLHFIFASVGLASALGSVDRYNAALYLQVPVL